MKGDQSLMSGFDPMRIIETILIFALCVLTIGALWAVFFRGAVHQLIIAVPSAIIALALTYQQTQERKDETNA